MHIQYVCFFLVTLLFLFYLCSLSITFPVFRTYLFLKEIGMKQHEKYFQRCIAYRSHPPDHLQPLCMSMIELRGKLLFSKLVVLFSFDFNSSSPFKMNHFKQITFLDMDYEQKTEENCLGTFKIESPGASTIIFMPVLCTWHLPIHLLSLLHG